MPHRFIVSAGRAGSTFLAHALNAHPQVCCQLESHHLPLLLDAFGDARAPARDLLRVMDSARFHTGVPIVTASLEPMGISTDAFAAWRADLGADHAPMTVGDFQGELVAFFLARTGKRVFVDKTPCYGFYLAALQSTLGPIRVVNLTRDCLPSILSMGRHPGFVAKLRAGVDHWTDVLRHHPLDTLDLRVPLTKGMDYVAMGELWARRSDAAWLSLGDQVTDIAYEQLLHDPGRTLRALCDALDVPFDADWAEHVARRVRPSATPTDFSARPKFRAIEDRPDIARVRHRLGYLRTT